jgi:hypothetical protein
LGEAIGVTTSGATTSVAATVSDRAAGALRAINIATRIERNPLATLFMPCSSASVSGEN